MANQILRTYQVLIAEYNAQHPNSGLTEEVLTERLTKSGKRFDGVTDERERQDKIADALLGEFYNWLHEKKVRRAALCLSGGGIRSGTFALGLIQGMARHDLLKKFDFLSTVSGGGYIGSWLTAWIHRHPRGLAGVTDELANANPVTKVDPDPPPVHYLREYSSFLTPKSGLFTVDTWTFIGIYLRNLVLNWSVFIPLILSVLMIPRLIVTLTLAQPEQKDLKPLIQNLLSSSVPFYSRHIFLVAGFALGIWALAYIIFNRPGVRAQLLQRHRFWNDHNNEILYQKRFLVFCLLPLIVSAVCLTTYWAWSREVHVKQWWVFLIFGVGFTFLSWLVASIVLRRLFHLSEILRQEVLLELLALLGAGLTGGIVFWILSAQTLGNPVVGYGNLGATGNPFPWTTWSIAGESGWTKWTTEVYACFGVPIFFITYLAAATIFVGLSSKIRLIEDEDREWWSRLGAWILIVIIAWTIANTLVIFGPIALLNSPKLLASIGGVSGLLAVLLGRSSKSKGAETPNERDKKSVGAFLIAKLLPLLAAVFIGALLAVMSFATTGIIQGLSLGVHKVSTLASFNEWLTNAPEPGFDLYIRYIYAGINDPDTFTGSKIVHMNVLHHTSIWFVSGLGLLMFAFGMIMARGINLNLFSLHAGYRNRIIRAFLGASRPGDERDPNPFTGFDPADNLHMYELRPALFAESDFVDPVSLAKALRDEGNPLSVYLQKAGWLPQINALANVNAPSPRLIAALRKDLNALLEEKDFYPSAQRLLPSGERNSPADRTESKDHLVRNRSLLQRSYPGLIKSDASASVASTLLPVVNTTLNLVGGDNLAWQQRKAEPFSITPLYSGCFRLGYRDSRDYGGRDTYGISLGTAAAISGAAASSNMGYYTTSPLISLLLTFFNVRLGWWLGNPGKAGNDTYELRAPKYSVAPIIYEALGLTNDKYRYVYLTDGGHFENLAFYEMVLRRCLLIVVSDGAQDADYHFTDLGNAVRKIRIDLGVPIEFPCIPIHGERPCGQGKGLYWALGRIRYTCIDKGPNAQDGLLLYLKPAVYGDEPRDVLEYKETYPAFPHQSTGDQFFDEPQFESYRILGSFIMDQLCGEGTDELTLYEVIEKALETLKTACTINPDFEKWLNKWKLRDK